MAVRWHIRPVVVFAVAVAVALAITIHYITRVSPDSIEVKEFRNACAHIALSIMSNTTGVEDILRDLETGMKTSEITVAKQVLEKLGHQAGVTFINQEGQTVPFKSSVGISAPDAFRLCGYADMHEVYTLTSYILGAESNMG